MRLLLACAALAVSAAAGCGMLPHVLYGNRIAGQVVDVDTGQPIVGAHVAFIWESPIIPSGFTGHNSRTICYHAAAAVTDHAGRFEIAPWRKWSTYDVHILDPIALVYARAYTPRQMVLQEGPNKPPVDRPNERYTLKVFQGTGDERMNALWGGIANRGCMYGGESQKSLYPMLKAIYEEARGIATTPAQTRRIHGYAVMAADAAMAVDPNESSNEAEVESFIKQRLQ